VDPTIASWFRAVDQDNSGQITAAELKRALVNGNWSNFSEEACKLMIGNSGKQVFIIDLSFVNFEMIRQSVKGQ
jgi:hypothetical protein